jgi:hypothetical protein
MQAGRAVNLMALKITINRLTVHMVLKMPIHQV